jgi:acetylglutamate kinase
MKQTREIIVRLLNAIGSRREVEQYLERFSSVDKNKFAVVKVGGGIVRDSLDDLASSLTFLQRVGLIPIVIHGAGPQLHEALVDAGIHIRHADGKQVTDAPTLDVARRVIQKVNLELVDALEDFGTRARPVVTGIFEASLTDPDKYGLVGDVDKIHLDPIRNAVNAGYIPILSSLGETTGGQIVNIDADVAARALARRIEPYKIVFITPTGGLLDEKDRIISSINLAEDYEHLMGQRWLHSGMRTKLEQIHGLLAALPFSSTVSITGPAELPRELFTHRGAGTFIQRGERVTAHDSWEGIDRERMKELLELCFDKDLDPDYFDKKTPLRVYRTESYRATAVVTDEEPAPYLDKFAVTPKAQGEGLGGSIWHRMKTDHPQLFWRSRSGNPVNPWYFEQADGTFRRGDWTVFWYGIDDYEVMRECVEHALAMPATLHARNRS